MPLKKIARHAREAWEVPRDILLRRYPEFVTGGPLPTGHVPVFVFHSLDPASFGRKVRYLADNGYVTLSADEYLQVLSGERTAPDRAVVLTFDDGRGTVWSVGYPILARHGMKGIVFLVPGRTVSRPGPLRASVEDAGDSAGRIESILGRERGDCPFLSWEEIGAIAESGLFDFQSHTHRHARIHTAPLAAGFVTPDQRRGYACMDVPLIAAGGHDLLGPEVPLGTPLFRSEPRTSEALRFYEDPGVRRAAVEMVEAEGGEGFFYRRGWERRLRRLLEHRPITGRLETPEERRAAIHHELAEAKRVIEERTGRPVIHLCYPWHSSGPTARRLAEELGYRTAFCGKVPGSRLTLPGGDPLAIARISEDYVELLPGRGRADLAAVLRLKWSRRLRGSA